MNPRKPTSATIRLARLRGPSLLMLLVRWREVGSRFGAPLLGSRYYVLDGHEPRPVAFAVWAATCPAGDGRNEVARTVTPTGFLVSTIFLGIDHNFGFGENARPVLFETMAFATKEGVVDFAGLEQERCCTWDEAEVQHLAMVARFGGAPA